MFMLVMLKTALKYSTEKTSHSEQWVLKINGRFHFTSSILHFFLGSYMYVFYASFLKAVLETKLTH